MYRKQLMVMSCLLTMVSVSAMLPQKFDRTIQKVANKTNGYKKLVSYQKRFLQQHLFKDEFNYTPKQIIISVPLGMLGAFGGGTAGWGITCVTTGFAQMVMGKNDDQCNSKLLPYGGVIGTIAGGTFFAHTFGGMRGVALWGASSAALLLRMHHEIKLLKKEMIGRDEAKINANK